jgi:hypothetical protein
MTGGIVFGQADFRPGYIILTSGDTIRGEINLRSSSAMSKECIFRTDDKSDSKKLHPDDLKEFRMDNGRYFVSRYLQNSGQVFLEYLVNGKLNLYYISESDVKRYYVQKEGDTIRELPEEVDYEYVNEVRRYRPPRFSRGLLTVLTSDAPELKTEINGIDPRNQKELVKLAVDYHHVVCSNEECMVYRKKIPFKISVQPLIGYTRYFTLNDGGFEYGANVNIWLPLENEKSYFRTGLFYGNFPAGIGEEWNSGKDLEWYLRIPLGFRYLGPPHLLRPEISIGPDLYISTNTFCGYTFNIDAALNVTLIKNKFFWTVGGGVGMIPPLLALFGDGFGFVSESAFTGFYYTF